ncbi:MAG: ATP-binding protein [Pseudomonadota bacterium]
MNNSIRRRLLLLLLSGITLAWIFTAITGYIDVRHEVDELFDAKLAQSAHVLLSISSHEVQEQLMFEQDPQVTDDDLSIYDEEYQYAHKVAYQIWIEPGQLVARSKSAPEYRLTQIETGYSDTNFDGYHWRIYSVRHPAEPITIITAERYDIRSELSTDITIKLIIPIVVSLPILALFIWFAVDRGLAPLHKLSTEIQNREPKNLKPIDIEHTPEEITPVVSSMNTLLQRLRTAFENERRFTADASHELRTPLAALKTHAQVALRLAENETQKKSLHQVISGVDRASHLVDQLLTLARLDPEKDADSLAQDIDLCEVAASVIGDLSGFAHEKKIDLGLQGDCRGRVRGNAGMLAIMIRNLVDNALRYTPADGVVEVAVTTEHDRVMLRVMDNGPGIPEEARAKVFERFYRQLGTQAPGVGLGLSIVARIIELHQAEIALHTSPLGGLEVRVSFTPAKSAEPKSRS